MNSTKRKQVKSQQLEYDPKTATAFPQHSGTAEIVELNKNILPPPFPQRFHKQQTDDQFHKFLDVLKQLYINIPLVEAL